MIVHMLHLTLLCVAREGEKTLERLRALGCAHLELASAAADPEVSSARGELDDAERACRLVEKAARAAGKVHGDGYRTVEAVLAADAERARLAEAAEKLARTVRDYAPFGDYDPALAAQLAAKGLAVSLVKGEKPSVADGAYVQCLGEEAWAVVGPWSGPCVPPPPERLAAMKTRLAALEADRDRLEGELAATARNLGLFTAARPHLRDRLDFAAAKALVGSRGEVAWIEGWLPKDAVPALRAAAVDCGWGVMLREPKEGEVPPTLIRPPKLFRPVRALFEALGIAPAYDEADVSVPFMCYFSLFFAMLVGDGGYGALIFALTMFGWWKTRPAPNAGHRPAIVRSWLALLSVFSVATIAWGALSNTWFGAALPFARTWPTVTWLADPSYSNMMFLCFTIGVTHLMVARLWSGIALINDRTCLAQFGWAGIVLFMYLVTNAIVGIFPGVPEWSFWMFGVSLALVFLFTLKGNELKSRGIELGMLPLNVMSALGDIISYVRLFAVGLASVKVAENFNAMAMNLDLPLWIKWLPLALILLIGHGLNFAMAGLSILVHAVRLNTLEFSNHKGISWAGSAYAPFKRRA